MNLPKIGRLGPNLKKIFLALKGFRRVFPRPEKTAIISLLLIAFLSIVLWVNDVRSQDSESVSMTYTEGWLVDNVSSVPDLDRLTNAGLTRYLKDGSIGADIADKWEESDDHQTYTFTINERYSSSSLLPNIQQNSDVFGDAEVSAPDEKTLVFKLPQPCNFFLAVTTEAIFPQGPYVVEDQSQQTVTLVSRKDYHLEKPYIKRIILRLYDNEDDLKNALASGKIDATADLAEENSKLIVQRIALPRFVSVFFNTRKSPFDNRDLRKIIIDGEDVSNLNLKIKLVTSTATDVVGELDGVVEKLQNQGIEVEVVKQDTGTLVSGVLADRDFDLLLFGIDYGYGEDLYPFWHSSRVDSPGNNFVGLKNNQVDWKIEEARTTSNMDERKQKISEAKELIKNEYVEIPLKQKVVLYQSSDDVQNNTLEYLADPLDRFNYINEWVVN